MTDALVINDTTYSGTAASYLITKAVTGADTIQKGCAFVEDGIKKKKTIPRLDISNFMQHRAAIPTSQGAFTIDGRVLEPKDSMSYIEFNPRDFESHWFAEQLSPTLLARELPAVAESYIMMYLMEKLNEWFENAWWRSRIQFDPTGAAIDPTTKGAAAGDVDYCYMDGFIKKALDAPDIVPVTSPVALTSANIISKFRAAMALVPKGLLYKYGKMGLKFHVSYADQQKYQQALQDTTFKNQDTTEKGINRYDGYEVEPLAGLPENTFFLCVSKPDLQSNLWIGMNSQQDNSFELKKLQANGELFFVKGLFKTDTQIGFADYCVIYTTQTA